jgi:hypothetical protein
MDIGVPTQMKEVLGRKLDKKSGVPAKWVYAENGDIVLDARNGNIVLRAQNIQLHAVDALGGQITLDASKIVNISSPIFNATSDYAHLSCAANIDIVGGSSGIHGEFANENTKGTEETDTSFFGKILTGIKKFKKFFKSNCE